METPLNVLFLSFSVWICLRSFVQTILRVILINYYCPLGLLCGRRLKSDVRSSGVREEILRFLPLQFDMGHRNWVLLLTEETKSAHFGTLKFDHLPRSAVVTFCQLFSKTAKKSTSGIWR